MPGDPKKPEVGELVIDASVCAPFIINLPPGGLVGLRTEHEGVGEVVSEIGANQVGWGNKAGVTAGDFDQVMMSTNRIREIDICLPAARKLVELLEETRAHEVDARERSISAIAQSVEARAKQPGAEGLTARYEKTCSYRSEFANKAASTRKKNAAAKTAKEGGNGDNG
ncbi:MAG: hypothetical protein QM820_54820 [Minicystis sp.]